MRRYSLIFLVLCIIVLNALMRQAAEAHPLMNPDMWDIRRSLPVGVAAAGLLMACLGMGAQFWQAVLPLCGGEAWSPRQIWAQLSACGLWCGWIPLLCALPFLPGMPGTPSPWLVGGFVALVCCRMLSLVAHRRSVGLLTATLSAAVALLCGQFLWPSAPLCVFTAALLAASAAALLPRRSSAPQMVWLLVAALVFCAYAASFGYMLAFYVPSEAVQASPWGMRMACALLAPALLLILCAPLRRSLWGRRVVALVSLAVVAVWLWGQLSSTLSPEELLPSAGFAGLACLLFCVSAGMMLYRACTAGRS